MAPKTTIGCGLFIDSLIAEARLQNPGLTGKELSELVGNKKEQWRNLTADERKYWNELFLKKHPEASEPDTSRYCKADKECQDPKCTLKHSLALCGTSDCQGKNCTWNKCKAIYNRDPESVLRIKTRYGIPLTLVDISALPKADLYSDKSYPTFKGTININPKDYTKDIAKIVFKLNSENAKIIPKNFIKFQMCNEIVYDRNLLFLKSITTIQLTALIVKGQSWSKWLHGVFPCHGLQVHFTRRILFGSQSILVIPAQSSSSHIFGRFKTTANLFEETLDILQRSRKI